MTAISRRTDINYINVGPTDLHNLEQRQLCDSFCIQIWEQFNDSQQLSFGLEQKSMCQHLVSMKPVSVISHIFKHRVVCMANMAHHAQISGHIVESKVFYFFFRRIGRPHSTLAMKDRPAIT